MRGAEGKYRGQPPIVYYDGPRAATSMTQKPSIRMPKYSQKAQAGAGTMRQHEADYDLDDAGRNRPVCQCERHERQCARVRILSLPSNTQYGAVFIV